MNADKNAALNIAARLGDKEIAACTERAALKALLLSRHQAYLTFLAAIPPLGLKPHGFLARQICDYVIARR